MSTLSLEYIAGLIDADGSISISVSKNRYTRKDGTDTSSQIAFVINFRQVKEYEWVLLDLQETLRAGKIYNHSNVGGRPMLTWQTTKESETLEVCETLLPYLKIKKPQAEFMIQALNTWKDGRLSRKGAGYYHTDEAKAKVLEISSQMNPSQQKETSRRNKEIRSEYFEYCEMPCDYTHSHIYRANEYMRMIN